MGSPPMVSGLALLLFVAGVSLAQQLKLSPTTKEHVRFEGKSLYVSCESRDAEGMVWHGPGGKAIVDSHGDVRVEKMIDRGDGWTGVDLYLYPVRRKDRGKYTCRANVQGAQVEQSFILVVNKRITFNEDQRTQFASEDSDFTMRCDISGDPKPKVDWRGKTALRIGPDKKFDIESETRGLIIRNVTRADEGTYVCKATQVSAKVSDLRTFAIQLKVQYKPEWPGPPPALVYGYVQGDANLTCHALAIPAPVFRWQRRGQLLAELPGYRAVNTRNHSVLLISSLNETTFGDYTCEAENQVGFFNQVVTLMEGNKPEIPTVSVTSAGSHLLTLSIECRPEEMSVEEYRVEYKTAAASWDSAQTTYFSPAGVPYVITGLLADTEYELRAATRNEAGYGDFSGAVRHRTAAARQLPTGAAPTGTAPPPPPALGLLGAPLLAALLVL